MTKHKSTPTPQEYKASLVAARKAGGNEVQSHMDDRLKAAVKRAAKPKNPPAQ